MKDQREYERDRKLIEQDNAQPPKRDIHAGDHAVIITAIAGLFFYMGYVYGAQVSPAVSYHAAAHAVH